MRRFKNAWTEFMNNEIGHITRTQPSMKKRQYAHIEIQSEFLRLEENRKKERFRLLTYRKKLLNDRLKTQQNLLEQKVQQKTPVESDSTTLPKIEKQVAKLFSDIGQLDKQLSTFEGQIAEVEKDLENTESEYVLLQGGQKLSVDNHITYIRYMTMHGFTLHPQTQKAVESIHYLMEHNLPIAKYKLYEIAPEMFQSEINQLDESTRRLLEEKKLVFLENSDSLVRIYQRKQISPQDKVSLMIKEVDDMWININMKGYKLLLQHHNTIDDIANGRTRFRSFKHFYYECIDIDDPSQFTPQQFALKTDILTIQQWKKDYKQFERTTKEAVDKSLYALRIPIFVMNNPKLAEFWKKRHNETLGNVRKLTDSKYILPNSQAKHELEDRLREALKRELPANFKFNDNLKNRDVKNDAYNFVLNIFTRVINELPEDLQDEAFDRPQPKEMFEKMTPQKKKELMGGTSYTLPRQDNRMTLDQMTKMIQLNNKDPIKYNIEFFSKYFGINPKLLMNVINYVSYPKIDEKGDKEILRFVVRA